MEFLQTLVEHNNIPSISAFLLGLLTAVSPCSLTTNITAIGYISKDIANRHRIFINGVFYALGQIVSYTVLGCILIPILRKGASIYAIQKFISQYGGLFLAPILILFGIWMLNIIKINFPQINIGGNKLKHKMRGCWGAFVLGILLANAFCPTTAMFYFGMLMPMSATEPGGYFLPVIYALATGFPVILFAWVLAYSVAQLGKIYNCTQVFEKWFRLIVAVLFIAIGIYYTIMIYM